MKVAIRSGNGSGSGGDAARLVEIDLPDAPGAAVAPDVELRQPRPGLYGVLIAGRSYEVAVEVEDGGEAAAGERGYRVTVDGAAVALRALDARRRALEGAAAGPGASAGRRLDTVVAPMPGKVVAVQVEPGATVTRGQPVVVLEAMKMESALAAPHDGTVTEVLVSPGQTVQQRQALVRIGA